MKSNRVKKLKKKISIRAQLALTFIGLMTGVIVLCLVCNKLFLSEYYTYAKKNIIKSAYEELLKTSTTESFSENAGKPVVDSLNKLAMTYNISIMVLDSDSESLYTSVNANRELAMELVGFILNVEPPLDKEDEIEKTEKYTLRRIRNQSGESLEMLGYLDDGVSFIMRTPMESIRESANYANKFFLYIGLIGTVCGGVVILLAANSLQKDLDRRDAQDEMRQDFIANVSHELKTPIALIQGYAEGLKEGITDDQESRDYYLDVIIDESDKMSNMVKKFLTLNQLEFGVEKPANEDFDIAAMIKGFLQQASILTDNNGIALKTDFPESTYVCGDAYLAEEVLTNYFSNAVNHCAANAGGEKFIELKLSSNKDKIRISVFNTGENIPKESLDKLWEKFYKVDKARTREYGGSGVGLSIVKAVQDSIGEGYGAENRPGGVLFWYELSASDMQ